MSNTGSQLEVLPTVGCAKILGHSGVYCSFVDMWETGLAILGIPDVFWGSNTSSTPCSLYGLSSIDQSQVGQDLSQNTAITGRNWLVELVTI